MVERMYLKRLMVIAVIVEAILPAQTETVTWIPAADTNYQYTFITSTCKESRRVCSTYNGFLATVKTVEEHQFINTLIGQLDRVTIGLSKQPNTGSLKWHNPADNPYTTSLDSFWLDPPGKPALAIDDWTMIGLCFCVAIQTGSLKWVTVQCDGLLTTSLCKRLVDACPDKQTNCRNNPNAVCDDSGTCTCKPGFYNGKQCQEACPPSACTSTPCSEGSTCTEKCTVNNSGLVSTGYECIAVPTTATTTITTTTITTTTTPTTTTTRITTTTTTKRIPWSTTTTSKTTHSKTTRSTTENPSTVDSTEEESPQNTTGSTGSAQGTAQGAIIAPLPVFSGANRLLKMNTDCFYELSALMNVIFCLYCLYLIL